MLLEPCKLPPTSMLSECNRYKVSEITSQQIAVCWVVFVYFFVVVFGFFCELLGRAFLLHWWLQTFSIQQEKGALVQLDGQLLGSRASPASPSVIFSFLFLN